MHSMIITKVRRRDLHQVIQNNTDEMTQDKMHEDISRHQALNNTFVNPKLICITEDSFLYSLQTRRHTWSNYEEGDS